MGHSCSVDNKFHKLFCRDLDEMINGTSHHMLRYNLSAEEENPAFVPAPIDEHQRDEAEEARQEEKQV